MVVKESKSGPGSISRNGKKLLAKENPTENILGEENLLLFIPVAQDLYISLTLSGNRPE